MKTAAKFGIIFGSFAALAVAGALKADARLPFKSQKELVGKAPESRWLAKSPKPEFGGIRYRLKDSWIGFGLGLYARTGGSGATGITPAMAMLTAYSRTLTDEVAAYEATYTGASHKTVTDHYGLLTFAPNNRLTYSNIFSNAFWIKTRSSVSTYGGADAFGGTDAWELIEDGTPAASHSVHSSINTLAGESYIASVYAKANTRTWIALYTSSIGGVGKRAWFNLSAGTVGTTDSGLTASISEAENGFYRCSIQFTATGIGESCLVYLADGDNSYSYDGDNSSSVYIQAAQSERVTYETTPRTYNATTSAAYYGPRFVYAPETLQTSSTSLTIGSGSSYTFGVADESLYSIGDVVQGTNNSDPDAWVRGYVTGTSTGFVTIGTYTFPGTAYSRPVLTNGSGTISDWSVIRSDGYLAEPAATNLALYSTELNNAYYSVVRCAFTANTDAAPNGLTEMDRIDCNSSSANGMSFARTTAITITNNAIINFSVYSKVGSRNIFSFYVADSGAGNGARVFFNLSTGAYVSSSTVGTGWSVVGTPKIESLPGGIYRMSAAIQTVGTSVIFYVNPSITSSSDFTCTSGVDYGYGWGVQLTESSVAISYIPTVASSVARAADVDSLSTATWWNGSGTFFTRAKTPSVGALSILKLDDGTSNEVIDLYTNGTDPVLQITDGGSTQLAPLDLGTVTADTFHDYAIRIATNNVNGALDGTAVTADTTVTLPTVTALSMGEHGGVAHLLYFTSEEIDSVLETGSGG